PRSTAILKMMSRQTATGSIPVPPSWKCVHRNSAIGRWTGVFDVGSRRAAPIDPVAIIPNLARLQNCRLRCRMTGAPIVLRAEQGETTMSDRKLIPGKFAWYELVTREAKKAQAFYGEVLGWRVEGFPMGNFSYDMIYAGPTMIGGYAMPRNDRPSHWIAYVSVEDVDASAKVAVENGGKIVEPPSDIPNVGRRARIADPQGAELC